MSRSIVAGSRVEPSGELGGVPVPGPDEDAFTLSVAAIDRLPWPVAGFPVRQVQPFGPFPPALAGDLGEALGRPGIDVRPARPLPELGAGLISLLDDPTEEGGVALVLPTSVPQGAPVPPRISEAIALGFARGPGVRLRGSSLPAGGADGARIDDLVQELRGHSSARRAASDPRPAPAGRDVEVDGGMAWSETRTPVGGRFQWESPAAYSQGSSADPWLVSEGAYLPWPTYLAHRSGRWRLAAAECGACGARFFPWRGSCPNCGRSDRLERRELSRSGLEVEATTVVHPGAQPSEFDLQAGSSGSYEVVVARADPHIRVTLQLTGASPGSVRIGDRVDAVLRRLFPLEGAWRYGLKAIPAAPMAGTTA